MDYSPSSSEELRALEEKRQREGLSEPEEARRRALAQLLRPPSATTTSAVPNAVDPIAYAQKLVALGHDPVLAFLQAGETLDEIAGRGHDVSSYLAAGPGAGAWPARRLIASPGVAGSETSASAAPAAPRTETPEALALWEADRLAMLEARAVAQRRFDQARAGIRERAQRANAVVETRPPLARKPTPAPDAQVQAIVARLRPPSAAALLAQSRPPSSGLAGAVPPVKAPTPVGMATRPVVTMPAGPATSEILVGTELLVEDAPKPASPAGPPPLPRAPVPVAPVTRGPETAPAPPSLRLAVRRVLVYQRDGSVKRGTLVAQDLGAPVLNLELSTGGVLRIPSEQATVIFFLGTPGTIPVAPGVAKSRVALVDGWNLVGFVRPRPAQAPGFFVVPFGPAGDTEQVFVFERAVRSMTSLQ